MKRRRPEEIVLNSMPHIKEIGDLEGKKSLFEDINLISKRRPDPEGNPANFV